MKVQSGDLIQADRHGAVVVPLENIAAMAAALDGLMKREARIIAAALASKLSRHERRSQWLAVSGTGPQIDYGGGGKNFLGMLLHACLILTRRVLHHPRVGRKKYEKAARL
jgi:hypothetical protein